MEATTDRRYADRLHREAGWAFSRCAKTQDQLALALDVDPSTASRVANGKAWGRVQRLAVWLEKLARADKTRAAPILEHLQEVVRRAYGEMDPAVVQERLERELDSETPAQASEDVAEFDLVRALRSGDVAELRRALEAFIPAARVEIDHQLEAVLMAEAMLRWLR